MGFIGDVAEAGINGFTKLWEPILGSSGVGGGADPTLAPIERPATVEQANQTYEQAQQALAQQAAFAQAVAGQQGLGNQTAAFQNQAALAGALAGQGVNMQGQVLGSQAALTNQLAGQNAVSAQNQALGSQQALAQALAGQGGVANQSSVFGQQQALANQLQGVASGTGPNPAQAQLAQATGANVANQAALMAGQRGANANAGLIARQIAQQGANIQQQAAGQAATLGAQQQIAGMSALAAQQAQLGQTAQAQIANQAAQQGAVAGLTQQQIANLAAQQQATAATAGQAIGQQQAANQAMAGTAAQQVAQQQAAIQAYNQAAQSGQQNILNAIAAQNNAAVGAQSSVNAGNVAIKQQGMQGSSGLLGGLIGAGGTAIAANSGNKNTTTTQPTTTGGKVAVSGGDGGYAKGGMVKGYADGGQVMGQALQAYGKGMQQGAQDPTFQPKETPTPDYVPASTAGRFLYDSSYQNTQAPPIASAEPINAPLQPKESGLAKALPMLAMLLNKGGEAKAPSSTPINAKNGGHVPGKPEVGGAKDSYKNDTVPAVLSPGEIVIPRSITQAPNAPERAAEFVRQVQAKHAKGKAKRK